MANQRFKQYKRLENRLERYAQKLQPNPAASSILDKRGDKMTAMRGAANPEYGRGGILQNEKQIGNRDVRESAQDNSSGGKTRKAGPTQYSPNVQAAAAERAKIRFARKQANVDFKNHEKYDEKYLDLDIDNLKKQGELARKQGTTALDVYKKLTPKQIKVVNQMARMGLRKGDQTNDFATKQSLNQFKQFGDEQGKVIRSMQEALDPRAFAAREAAGQAVMNDFKLGSGLSAGENREWEQSVRAGQAARGNVLGNAPITSEAMTKGNAGYQRYQQRLGNLNNFGQTMQQPTQTPTIFHAGMPYSSGGGGAMPGGGGSGGILGGGLPSSSSGVGRADLGSAPIPDYNGYAAAQAAQQQASASKPNPWIGAASGAVSGAAMGMPLAGATYGIAPLAGAAIGGLAGYFMS